MFKPMIRPSHHKTAFHANRSFHNFQVHWEHFLIYLDIQNSYFYNFDAIINLKTDSLTESNYSHFIRNFSDGMKKIGNKLFQNAIWII